MGVFASLGLVLYGYDLGVIAEAIASTNFNDLFHPTSNQTYGSISIFERLATILTNNSGAVVSVFTGGGFFGALFAGPIG